uniref:Uncharacterized protein n=1 Tax=Arundo donax TaxID=35708 RepID=A0A0A8ZT24_ARUDO
MTTNRTPRVAKLGGNSPKRRDFYAILGSKIRKNKRRNPNLIRTKRAADSNLRRALQSAATRSEDRGESTT